MKLLAIKVYERYQAEAGTHAANVARIGLPPFADLNRSVLDQLLDPKGAVPFAARAIIRSQLGMAVETNAPPETMVTNVPVTSATAPTNSSATNAAGQ